MNDTKKLKDYHTCELVDELKLREGVQHRTVGPNDDERIDVIGPAVVLVSSTEGNGHARSSKIE